MRHDELTEMLRRTAAGLPVDDHPDLDAIHARSRRARRRRTALTIAAVAAVVVVLGVGISVIARHDSSPTDVHTAAIGATTVPETTNPPTTMSASTAPPTTVHMPCPTGGITDPSGNAGDPDYVGLTLEQAQALATKQGHPLLLIERDGQPLPYFLDLVVGRVDIVINDNVVTQACHE